MREKLKTFIKNNKFDVIFYLIITGLFLFTRLYKILTVPYGMHIDEVSMGYNVWSLTEYGVDRYNNPYPVYFNNSGSGQSCLYVYMAVILSKIFGYSLFTLRFVAVILGAILLVFGTKIALKLQGKRFAKIVSVLIVTLPFFITSERFAFDCYAMVSMYVMTFYWFLQMLDTKKTRYAVLTGLGISLTLYSYVLAYIILPVFIVLVLIYLIVSKRFNFKNILVIGLVTALTSLPIVYYVLVIFGVAPSLKTSFITITNASASRIGELKLYHRSFGRLLKRFYTLLTIDSYDFTSAGVGTIYNNEIHFLGSSFSFEVILFLVAFGVFLYRLYKKRGNRFLVLIYGFSTVFLVFLLRDTIIYRHNAFYFFVVLVLAELVDFLIDKKLIVCTGILICLLVGNFSSYTYDLLLSNKTIHLDYFDNDLLEVSDYIKKNDGFKDYTVYVDNTASFSASLMLLYGLRISPKQYAESIESDHYFEASFLNYKFEVPEIKGNKPSKGVYILRNYTESTKLYVSDITDRVSINDSISRANKLRDYFSSNGIKEVKVSNYSIFCVN